MRDARQERARRSRLTVGRWIVSGALVAFGLLGFVACGFTSTATGVAGLDGAATIDATSSPGSDSMVTDLDGGDEQNACTATSTVCGASCTDVQADPLNCGSCGKKCGVGETCSAAACTVLCVTDKVACNGACVDTQTDPTNCGVCNKPCTGGLLCAAGLCRADCGALTRCSYADAGVDAGGRSSPDYCADETSDRDNCGACGHRCAANETCSASSCIPLCAPTGSIGDVFAPSMVGCFGTIGFQDRATFCPAGAHVCKAQEYLARRGNKAPTYNYWTDDRLYWSGRDGDCTVSTRFGGQCSDRRSPEMPMRVCGAKTDPVGNLCRYTGCGYETTTNQYFGGCQGDPTAGTLCCTP